jgi:hypothetical protein
MRLLHTHTMTLKQFFQDQMPPYAILSHRWGTDELTYEDVASCSTFPSNIKIDGCCKQALADGLEYIWIDTLCIDKSSSSELSESINSMFAWYRDSQVCYAYLFDVLFPLESHNASRNSEFKSSEWFTRGWTLQELLAPKKIKFYTKSWDFIGSTESSNHTFCTLLHKITTIPREVLDGSQSITQSSIATRMGWAAHRRTTRKEDTAYCLLGIFDINMPLLYGEGENAFKRLQEEIIRQSDDESFLAWGFSRSGERNPGLRLLAKSPDDFMGSDDIRILSGIWPGYSMRSLPHYSMTNKGLLLERPFKRLPHPFNTVLMPLDCTVGYRDQILAIPLIGNLTTDSQLRTGPSTKPVLVSAKIFESSPISRVYLKTSEWTMPRESTGFLAKIEQYPEDSTLQLVESYPTSCAGLSLGNGQPSGLVEIISSPWSSSEPEGPVASHVVLLRLRGSNNRTYLVQIVVAFKRKFDFDYIRDSLTFGVIEECQNMSLAEFILEKYVEGRSSPLGEWPHSSSDGFLRLKFDVSPYNWVLTFLVGYKLSAGVANHPVATLPVLNSQEQLESLIEVDMTELLPEMTQPSGIKTVLLR